MRLAILVFAKYFAPEMFAGCTTWVCQGYTIPKDRRHAPKRRRLLAIEQAPSSASTNRNLSFNDDAEEDCCLLACMSVTFSHTSLLSGLSLECLDSRSMTLHAVLVTGSPSSGPGKNKEIHFYSW